VKVCGEANMPASQAARMYSQMHTFTDAILISLLQTYESLEHANR
jgi:hypothetical protein